MKKANNNGRKAASSLPGAGYQKRREVSVDDKTVDTLRQLGKGNLSAGVRKAAAIVETLKEQVDK